ncbi:CG32533, partial [Drosophila busckii]
CFKMASTSGGSQQDLNQRSINLIEFSFLNHRAELSPLLSTNNRHPVRLVENEDDFWKFVNKYECMLRSMGHPMLPACLKGDELNEIDPFHKYKYLSIEMDGSVLRMQDKDELEKQFKQLVLIYLDFKQKEKFARLRKLRKGQKELPITAFKQDFREALDATRVIIVAGDTGCGKSTQVPQYLYEFGYRGIACTQPRRLACVALAKRVAQEMLDDYGTKVGFQIRFERNRTQNTNILFITEGLLLRQLALAENLEQYDVIILDEIHERNLFGDFLLGVTKCLLRARPQIKLILMSATINVELFHNFFRDEGARLVQVPGRLFPIRLRYMPPPALELNAGQASAKRKQNARLDPAPYIQVLSLIDQQYPLTERGDVLIFVSGVAEIETVCEAVIQYAKRQRHWIVLPLHSGLGLSDQDRVFDYAREGMRKCIVSTNIAETSLTVDGVRFVIDSGKVKQMSFDAVCKGQRLKEFWVSKSSAEQRKGRAGRTGPGVCFRLYGQQQFDAFEAFPIPEIFRVPLDAMLLAMVAMGLPDVRVFPFVEPPDSERLEQTILDLKHHCAMTAEEKLTPLGSSLAKLPVDLPIGKMLLMGCVFPDVEQLLTLASMMSVQNPFTTRAHSDQRCEREREPLESEQGDLFTLMRAYCDWVQLKRKYESSRKWCQRLGLEEQRLYEVSKLRQQFQHILEGCSMAPASSSSTSLSKSERSRRAGELRMLRELKRRQRFGPQRQRKLLKHQPHQLPDDYDDDDDDDFDDDDESQKDMRDVDFRLRHDGRQLALLERSARMERDRDVMLMKILIVSGFYPQLAIADEFNYCKGGTQQFFHAQLKPFLSLHPNSYFAKNYELLKLTESDIQTKPDYYTPKQPLSDRHQLLCYQSLLETAKPYLMNCIRLPAAQTLLLFAYSIDTNASVTRIVFDGWLSLDFPTPGSGLKLLSRAIQLRRHWNSRLFAKLNELNRPKCVHPSHHNKSPKEDKEDILWYDLVDFMNLNVVYSIKRLLPADLKVLYTRCAPNLALKENPFADNFELKVNADKGGFNVSENVVYACLAEQPWCLAMDAALQAQPWKCADCDLELEQYVVTEQLQHRLKCKRRVVTKRKRSPSPPKPKPDDGPTCSKHAPTLYHCLMCGLDLHLSQIDILRHRKQCSILT